MKILQITPMLPEHEPFLHRWLINLEGERNDTKHDLQGLIMLVGFDDQLTSEQRTEKLETQYKELGIDLPPYIDPQGLIDLSEQNYLKIVNTNKRLLEAENNIPWFSNQGIYKAKRENFDYMYFYRINMAPCNGTPEILRKECDRKEVGVASADCHVFGQINDQPIVVREGNIQKSNVLGVKQAGDPKIDRVVVDFLGLSTAMIPQRVYTKFQMPADKGRFNNIEYAYTAMIRKGKHALILRKDAESYWMHMQDGTLYVF